jgi:uncharacterized membrane protein YciS (DUF1049 family)
MAVEIVVITIIGVIITIIITNNMFLRFRHFLRNPEKEINPTRIEDDVISDNYVCMNQSYRKFAFEWTVLYQGQSV